MNIKTVKARRFIIPEFGVFKRYINQIVALADCFTPGRNKFEVKTVNAAYFSFEPRGFQIFGNGCPKVNIFYVPLVSFGDINLAENARKAEKILILKI